MKIYIALFSLIIGFLTSFTAPATSMLPISLEQLSTRATLIIYAEAVSNEVKKDTQSRQIATFTTFKVIDVIKGSAQETHTIKQIGGKLEGSNTTLRIHGVPKFVTGEKYVVFLPEKSSLGFSSPLGLHQGRFSVTTINNEQIINSGRSLASQSQTNPEEQTSRAVQVPLAVRADKPSQARLDDFINTVRAYNTK